MKTELMKFAYLLDEDNYCVENKIFIDLIWHIAKTELLSEDKNGKLILKFKSYVIRNAAIMFQQIFYWHFNAIKQDKPTKYRYKEQNVVKMDFEDWWNSIRLTDADVSSANKLLIETKLVTIVKMRIKQKDKNVYKPSNCYLLNSDILEKYLNEITDISKNMYEEKVTKVREENIKSTVNWKQSKDLSTNKSVTPVTGVTLNSKVSEGIENDLSTLSTISTDEKNAVTPVTSVTKVTPVTHVTEVTPVTSVTNKSNTSCSNTSCADTSEEVLSSSIPCTQISWSEVLESLKLKIPGVSFKTWFQEGIAKVEKVDNEFNIWTLNKFTADILKNRYCELIQLSIGELTTRQINITINHL